MTTGSISSPPRNCSSRQPDAKLASVSRDADDPFGPEEPTQVTHGIPTPPRGMPLPDVERAFQQGLEKGYGLGHHRGIADAFHGLRLALTRVGVPPEEVEPIVMTVRLWVR